MVIAPGHAHLLATYIQVNRDRFLASIQHCAATLRQWLLTK